VNAVAGAVLFTIAFLPIYLLIRRPFARLPLHIDTGFYVPNHTIVTRRWRFREGWNAHYAGCSKGLPELFYSAVFLLHPGHYKRMSRHYASVFNYVTAVFVGVLAFHSSGGDFRYYCAALVAFALVSSEPHYGVYHECAELFELLFQTAGLTCVIFAVKNGAPSWLFAGALLWAGEAFFIKLSSVPAFVVLFGGLAFARAWTVPWSVSAGLSAFVLYVLWILWNGRNPLALIHPLRGHEANFQPQMSAGLLVHRFGEKVRCLARVFGRQPLIPILAGLGLLASPPAGVFWIYLLAVTVTYSLQAADCRYYVIPFVAPLALSCSAMLVFVSGLGWLGPAGLFVTAIIWLVWNPLRAARLDDTALNRWCWQGFRPTREYESNRAIEAAVSVIRPVVADKTILVYGPFNQAYALLGAGYVTPIVAPESYLDSVSPGWQMRLNQRLLQSPPGFIFDTGASFDAMEARSKLGLDYRLRYVFGEAFRLFELFAVVSACPDLHASTFRPQSRKQRQNEESIASTIVRHAHDAGVPSEQPSPSLDGSEGAALATLLRQLGECGYQRLAVYGAGRFSTRLAETYRRSPVPVSVVLDDNAKHLGEKFLDWPVRSPDDVDGLSFDAVIISSDRFAGPMTARIRRCLGGGIPVFRIPIGGGRSRNLNLSR